MNEEKNTQKEEDLKRKWKELDSGSKSFWLSGGRGGEQGFIAFERGKLY
jgi:hypothetical protein